MEALSEIRAFAPSVQPLQASELAGPPVPPLSFRKVFENTLSEVNGLNTQAKGLVEAYATGQTSDLSGVMMAVRKSNLAFLTLLQIRNQLVDAYDEIMRMRM